MLKPNEKIDFKDYFGIPKKKEQILHSPGFSDNKLYKIV